jgi:hypothetical protein
LVGALAAITVGVLGLAAQNRRARDDATPRPSATATAGATGSPSASPSGSPSGPTMTIAEPADGATVSSSSVTVRVDVRGFELAGAGGTDASGEGHLIYYRNVDFVPTTAGEPARTAPGTFVASSELAHTWDELGPGSHVFFVQLVNSDDTPLQPAVVDSVTVEVPGGSPAPTTP